MPEEELRVWRAGPVTLVLISIFAVAAGIVIPVLAYLIYRNGSSLWLPALLIVLTVLALLYVWRFGFHPRLRVSDQTVEIINPFRRYIFEWDDITVIAPGENGLLIGYRGRVRRGMVRTEVQPREPTGPPHAGRPDRRRAARHLGSARSPGGERGERSTHPARSSRREQTAGPAGTRSERRRVGPHLPAPAVSLSGQRDCPALATAAEQQADPYLPSRGAGEPRGLCGFRRGDCAPPRRSS